MISFSFSPLIPEQERWRGEGHFCSCFTDSQEGLYKLKLFSSLRDAQFSTFFVRVLLLFFFTATVSCFCQNINIHTTHRTPSSTGLLHGTCQTDKVHNNRETVLMQVKFGLQQFYSIFATEYFFCLFIRYCYAYVRDSNGKNNWNSHTIIFPNTKWSIVSPRPNANSTSGLQAVLHTRPYTTWRLTIYKWSQDIRWPRLWFNKVCI